MRAHRAFPASSARSWYFLPVFSCCLLSVPAWSGVWKALRWWSCLDGVRLLRCVVGMSACSCLSQAVGRSAVVDRAWAWGYSPALTKQTAVFGGWCLPVLMADARLCARRPAALLHSLFLRPCLDLFPEMVVSLLFLGLVDLGYLEVALPAWFSSSFLPSLLSVAFLFSVAGCSQVDSRWISSGLKHGWNIVFSCNF